MAKRYDYTKANKEVVDDILEESAEVEDEITTAEELVEETIKVEEPTESYGEHVGKIVGCMNLNVRVEPNIESKVARIVSKNDTVTIVGESGDWYEIVTMGGDHGYSMKQYIDR